MADVHNNSDNEDLIGNIEDTNKDQTKSQKKKMPAKKRQVKRKEVAVTTNILTIIQRLSHPLMSIFLKNNTSSPIK